MFVPGLTDGLLALDYVPPLAEALDRLGYSFVQPVLSSSYKGVRKRVTGLIGTPLCAFLEEESLAGGLNRRWVPFDVLRLRRSAFVQRFFAPLAETVAC